MNNIITLPPEIATYRVRIFVDGREVLGASTTNNCENDEKMLEFLEELVKFQKMIISGEGIKEIKTDEDFL